MSKKYVVIGIQPIEHKAVINADSKEQALKIAEEMHTAFNWEQINIGDWKYEILMEQAVKIEEEDDE